MTPVQEQELGTKNFYKLDWRMDTDNPYYGEIFAISSVGTPDIFATEY